MGRIKSKKASKKPNSNDMSSASKKRSKNIDEQLKNDMERVKKEVKILLLGAGETGKSTLVKQMKILHQNGFTPQECQEYKKIINQNVYDALSVILQAMNDLNIILANPERIVDSELFFTSVTLKNFNAKINADLVETMKRLWLDKGTQECFRRSSEYQLNDSAK